MLELFSQRAKWMSGSQQSDTQLQKSPQQKNLLNLTFTFFAPHFSGCARSIRNFCAVHRSLSNIFRIMTLNCKAFRPHCWRVLLRKFKRFHNNAVNWTEWTTLKLFPVNEHAIRLLVMSCWCLFSCSQRCHQHWQFPCYVVSLLVTMTITISTLHKFQSH